MPAPPPSFTIVMANITAQSNSIISFRELPFSRRSNQEKLAVKELGPPRPNLNIKQISKKGGKSYTRGFSRCWYERKNWLAGCEVANGLFCYPCVLIHPVTLNLYRGRNLYRARHHYVIHYKPALQQMIASSVAGKVSKNICAHVAKDKIT